MLTPFSASLTTSILFCLVFVVCGLMEQSLLISGPLFYCVLPFKSSVGVPCVVLVFTQSMSDFDHLIMSSSVSVFLSLDT